MSTAAKWANMPCLGYDVESTGVDVYEDRIVTVALVDVRPTQRPVIRRYVVDPGIDIPDGAAAVHGYTRDRAIAEATHTVDQMLFEVTGQIALSLGHGIPVVAMNAAYDFTILEAENLRHGVEGLVARLGHGGIQPVIDPFVMDKHADKFRKGGRKLTDLCGTYDVRHTGAHDSAGDALAACRMWPKIIAKHPAMFRGQSLPGLHQAQVGWRREQMDGLRAYFDRKGTVHDGCDPGWPLLNGLARRLAAGAGVA